MTNSRSRISINFSRSERKLRLSLHYKGSNSLLFVNATKIYHFKAKGSKTKRYPLCLGNNSKDFLVDNMKKTGFNGYVYDFSVDYNIVDISNIINIHKYLIKKKNGMK